MFGFCHDFCHDSVYIADGRGLAAVFTHKGRASIVSRPRPLRNPDEPSIRFQMILSTTPHNRVAEETSDPEDEAEQILQRDLPPSLRERRIAQDPDSRRIGR